MPRKKNRIEADTLFTKYFVFQKSKGKTKNALLKFFLDYSLIHSFIYLFTHKNSCEHQFT